MDKNERKKGDKGSQNASQESHSHFNSIINLSPFGINAGAFRQHSPVAQDLDSKATIKFPKNDTINLPKNVGCYLLITKS